MKKRLLQQLARGEDWFVRGSTLIFYSFAGRYRGLTGDITPVLPCALHAAGSEDGFHPVTIPRCTGRGRVTLPVLSKSDAMFIILSSSPSPKIIFVLKSILSDSNIATQVFLWLLFDMSFSILSFCVSLHFRCVSYKTIS